MQIYELIGKIIHRRSMQERRIGNSSDTLINATGQKFKEGGGGVCVWKHHSFLKISFLLLLSIQ